MKSHWLCQERCKRVLSSLMANKDLGASVAHALDLACIMVVRLRRMFMKSEQDYDGEKLSFFLFYLNVSPMLILLSWTLDQPLPNLFFICEIVLNVWSVLRDIWPYYTYVMSAFMRVYTASIENKIWESFETACTCAIETTY